MEQDYELLDIIITILVAIFLIAGFIGCAAVGGEHLNDHINDKYNKDNEKEKEVWSPIYTYYPVDIDAKHNNHYALTVKIKGLGVENPGDNWEASGNLKLIMQVVDWEYNPIDKEF